MFGKYNGFVSKARVSACMYFLVYVRTCKIHTVQFYFRLGRGKNWLSVIGLMRACACSFPWTLIRVGGARSGARTGLSRVYAGICRRDRLTSKKCPFWFVSLFCATTNGASFLPFKVARYSYHKNPAQESRTQNRVTIFTRRSRKLINKMKELPK